MNRISFDDKVDARVLGGARINKVIADDMNQIKTAINTLVDSGADLPQFSTAARDLITPAPPLGYRIYNTTENRGEYYTSGGWLPFMGLKDIHAGSSPNFPSALRGDILNVTAAGKVGGVSGLTVFAGDLLVCKTTNAGGTFASVGTNWIWITSPSNVSWQKAGNAGTNSATDYIGTTDNEPLIIQPDNSYVGIGTDTPEGFEVNQALGGGVIGKIKIHDHILTNPINFAFYGFGDEGEQYWGVISSLDDAGERGIADIGWKDQYTQDSRHIKLGNNDTGDYPADDGRFLVIEAYDSSPFKRGKYNFKPNAIDVEFNGGDPSEERYDINLFDGLADNKLLMVQNAKTEMNLVSVSEILATLPTYASDVLAAAGGLAIGDSYFSTSTSSYTRRLV